MAAELTAEQEAATKTFLEHVNARSRRKNGVAPVKKPTAIRFLFARKFDVSRALALYDQHELTRQREGLADFDVAHEPLRSELKTGKFTILPTRDSGDARIAIFTAHKHIPTISTHQTTLQGVVYQLDVALQCPRTQRAGIVFIYDMSNSKYSNFDYDLSQKILTLLKGGYPAKLKKVLIVTAPLWFKAPFKILRLFVREKLRERVYTVSAAQLVQHIPKAALPQQLGGLQLHSAHDAWLAECATAAAAATGRRRSSVGSREVGGMTAVEAGGQGGGGGGDGVEQGAGGASTVAPVFGDKPLLNHDTPPTNTHNNTTDSPNHMLNHQPNVTNSNSNATSPSKLNSNHHHQLNATSADIDSSDTTTTTTANAATWQDDGEHNLNHNNPPSSASSGFSDDDSLHGDSGAAACTMLQLVEYVRDRGRQGLTHEYAEIRSRPPDGSFNVARQKNNLAKNRYTDVLCYDHSRVILSEVEGDCDSDYIHANFVDGYKQKNAFINTQGPLPKTTGDFWRMVWEQHTLVVVMTTRVMERSRPKCHQYWETDVDSCASYGDFSVRTAAVDANQEYTVTALQLTNNKTDETRDVSHWQFTSWPDYGVPTSAAAMLDFLDRVRRKQVAMVAILGDTWAGHPRGPPIVVHCSAGIGRTGTFCTLDICISRLEDVATVDIRGTVERIRAQRAYSIQMPDQYVFCHLALIEYALVRKHLDEADLNGFDQNVEEESD